ncbi:uncharacterized protein [Phyllobates terribilis]|uniref:uncharacterized protein n=1 Tax=Phyllobates terribilis TaxID=111132 RepID=UPI003CCAB499
MSEYIEENLARGFIRKSTSPAGAGFFFVKKKDGSLRPCIDYRGLNQITVKNKVLHPLPLIPELFDRLRGARIFTKLDLRGAYNLVRIRQGDEWKTAFNTRDGHYEYLVMPFGLCNAPAVFQELVNDIFRDLLYSCVVVYLDDILVFSPDLQTHRRDVRQVLLRLRQNHLFAKYEKCLFEQTSLPFLGYIISQTGLRMDPEKLSAIEKWPRPEGLKAIQRFLGFANYYRLFIPHFSSRTAPISALTRKGTNPKEWPPEAEEAFLSLKQAFSSAPVLHRPDGNKQFFLEVDASSSGAGAVLTQKSSSGRMVTCGFFSKLFSSSERNYSIGDRELLAIKLALEEWRYLLEGALHPTRSMSEYIEENLARGFIRKSTSPAGAGFFFVKKKDGSLRPCIDYRGLNQITVKNKYPLPLIPELFDRLRGARIFTKLDLRGAYNLVRIRQGDEWKTAFNTRDGHYEYLVMPFGLCNAPAVFQELVNDIFRDLLYSCVVVYLDDILVFSPDLQTHRRDVRQVLLRLRQNHLFAKYEKCLFEQTSLPFLGYIISQTGLRMDPEKLSAIEKWPRPEGLKAIQRFLGFANYYRLFIPHFSSRTAPISALTRKGTNPKEWPPEAEEAFLSLKQAFSSAPVLHRPDGNKQFFLEVDASSSGAGAVLTQKSSSGRMVTCGFFSKLFSSSERNYSIGDRELLAIKLALEEWRYLLEGALHPVIIYTDHKNLAYLQHAQRLNPHQARLILPGISQKRHRKSTRKNEQNAQQYKKHIAVHMFHLLLLLLSASEFKKLGAVKRSDMTILLGATFGSCRATHLKVQSKDTGGGAKTMAKPPAKLCRERDCLKWLCLRTLSCVEKETT